MSTQTHHLFLLDDLQDAGKTTDLAKSDLDALRAVSDWITTFVARPHKDIGRAGTVCPFVPDSIKRKTLWLTPEHVAGRSEQAVVQLMNAFKSLFMDARVGGDDETYRAFVVVFTDLSADRAKGLFDDVLHQLAIPWYSEDGLVLGAFYPGNQATAIYNKDFRPFTPPVPFLLVRNAVVSDWKFFIDNEKWLDIWANRFGVSAVHALADELRNLPWRASSGR